MNLGSLFELFSRKVDGNIISDISDSNLVLDKKFLIKIQTLENEIFSQGKVAIARYKKLKDNFSGDEIEISNKSISDSLRSRLIRKGNLSPLDELLNNVDLNDIDFENSKINTLYLNEIEDIYPTSLYSDLFVVYRTCIREVQAELKERQYIRLLQSFISKIFILFDKLYIYIPIIFSFFKYFDQVFTLKNIKFNLSELYVIIFNVKYKIKFYETKIFGIIPIAN